MTYGKRNFAAHCSIPLLALLALLLTPAVARASAADCTAVPTGAGPITGELLPKPGLCVYKGVPYAAPPVGDLRFAVPQPHKPWTEPLEAVAFSPICWQYPFGLFPAKEPAGSEDCLYMNIWQPTAAAAAKKPVMLYIHGGGFVNGSADQELYYGERLAAYGDVLVVTFNYRLGPFGYFSHPALRKGQNSGSNFGLYDQLAAMRWVKENIANFGGDPDNITLFGESAGGVSVSLWLLAPQARGMFQKAIVESGPLVMLNTPQAQADQISMETAALLGCGPDAGDAAACLRALPPEIFFEHVAHGFARRDSDDEISNESKRFSFQPSIDGVLVEDKPFALLARGQFPKDVPVVIGMNKDEASIFIMSKKLDTREQFSAALEEDLELIRDRFGMDLDVDAMTELFNPDKYESPRQAYSSMFTDMGFVCPSRSMAETLAAAGAPVRMYLFTKSPDEKGMAKEWGAFHGAELPFVFGNFSFLGLNFKSKDNTALSKDMIAMWSAFAHTGAPAAQGWPEWPLYTPGGGPYLRIHTQGAIEQDIRPQACRAFEDLIQKELAAQ
jgi:para-nitrobenzyl esterase